MNAFELRRLRREGKDVILPGGRSALEATGVQAFDRADKRIDAHYRKKRKVATDDELAEMADKTGLMPTMDLGC